MKLDSSTLKAIKNNICENKKTKYDECLAISYYSKGCIFYHCYLPYCGREYELQCKHYLKLESEEISYCTEQAVRLAFLLDIPAHKITEFCVNKMDKGNGCKLCKVFGGIRLSNFFNSLESE